MKTKTLKVSYYRQHSFADFDAKPLIVDNKHNRICVVWLEDFFVIPKKIKEIDGIISNKPFKECYKIFLRSPTSDFINIHINNDTQERIIFYTGVITIITKFMKDNKLKYAYVGVKY